MAKKSFKTKRLPIGPDALAPDSSDVRILLGLEGGGMVHFELTPGETAVSLAHYTFEDLW